MNYTKVTFHFEFDTEKSDLVWITKLTSEGKQNLNLERRVPKKKIRKRDLFKDCAVPIEEGKGMKLVNQNKTNGYFTAYFPSHHLKKWEEGTPVGDHMLIMIKVRLEMDNGVLTEEEMFRSSEKKEEKKFIEEDDKGEKKLLLVLENETLRQENAELKAEIKRLKEENERLQNSVQHVAQQEST